MLKLLWSFSFRGNFFKRIVLHFTMRVIISNSSNFLFLDNISFINFRLLGICSWTSIKRHVNVKLFKYLENHYELLVQLFLLKLLRERQKWIVGAMLDLDFLLNMYFFTLFFFFFSWVNFNTLLSLSIWLLISLLYLFTTSQLDGISFLFSISFWIDFNAAW